MLPRGPCENLRKLSKLFDSSIARSASGFYMTARRARDFKGGHLKSVSRGLELAHVELGVEAAGGKELLVPALLHDLPVPHD